MNDRTTLNSDLLDIVNEDVRRIQADPLGMLHDQGMGIDLLGYNIYIDIPKSIKECIHCSRPFKTMDALQRHINNKHSDKQGKGQ